MSNTAKRKMFRLSDLEINFVSACPQGANPGAKIILKKEAVMPDDKDKKEINVNIDIESLAKSLNESLKGSLDAILENKDLSKEAMAEAVVAVISGDIEKMKTSLNEQLTKTIADVQKELDEKIKASQKEQKEVEKEFDESLEINGTTFRKSIVGGEAFAAIKASHVVQQEIRKELEQTKLVARVEKEFPNVAGKPEEKAALLDVIEKADESVRKIGLSMLKTLNDTSGEFAKEYGAKGAEKGANIEKLETDSDATMKLQKMAQERAKKDGISVSKAWELIFEDDPEAEKLYNEHLLSQQK